MGRYRRYTGWYWEEEYIEHIKKSFAHVVEAEGGEAVSRRKEFNDVDQANDLSIIVGIGRELIMLLKCILVLVFLVLVAIVFVVAKLSCMLDMLCNKMRNYMCVWFL